MKLKEVQPVLYPDLHSSKSDDRFQEHSPSPLTRRSFGEMFMQIESLISDKIVLHEFILSINMMKPELGALVYSSSSLLSKAENGSIAVRSDVTMRARRRRLRRLRIPRALE
ncbi:hypothetical protein NPIL_74411 [Nephila pilipes]|uniref:Uncharacterized protein n=1 Tax=Nephila pilipes TaxID=299642 RepID=A0A8X6PQN5_NEPPI|nr:hypothetical protein NPIL_74411 [Nephila pilipes]